MTAILDGGKTGVDMGLAIIPGVLIICTLVMMFTNGPSADGTYTGAAYEGIALLPALGDKIDFLLKPLFGFTSNQGISVPITSLGAAGAAIGLVPKLVQEGAAGGNDIAVFTAMCMCWSGYLSTHVAMMDSLGYSKMTGKAIISHTIGGLCAGSLDLYADLYVGLSFGLNEAALKSEKFDESNHKTLHSRTVFCCGGSCFSYGGKALQGRELTEWEELAGGYAVFCHCLYQPTREKYFQKAEQWLQDERIKVYAAVEENRLLGMIVLCIQGQQAEIVGISVCPQERHRGIGSWLIEWAMQKYNLTSLTAQTDGEAVGFYRKVGFTTKEERVQYGTQSVLRYRCLLHK